MKKYLIGNSGLIGKNLIDHINFDHTFNSSNINTFNDICENDSILYLSCLPATKWLVNKDINSDIKNINTLVDIIKQKRYNKVILISTIDVYSDTPLYANEDITPTFKKVSYGTNRYLFELLLQQSIISDKIFIFRLPALFGPYIKKNVLYDLIHKNTTVTINFNSFYQWYNLCNLIQDIEYFITNKPDDKIYNLFTEPIYTQDIITNWFPHSTNIANQPLVEYNYMSKFSESGYLRDKKTVLNELEKFIYETSSKSISME